MFKHTITPEVTNLVTTEKLPVRILPQQPNLSAALKYSVLSIKEFGEGNTQKETKDFPGALLLILSIQIPCSLAIVD